MFDIDAGHAPTLRLNTLTATDQEIASIEKQMEALSLRHCELMEAKRIAFAQARPIPVSMGMSGNFTVPASQVGFGMGGGVDPGAVVGFVTNVHHDGEHVIVEIRGTDPVSLTDNDFWTNRHRVMTGPQPMIARTTGHIDRMTAAAAGEIEDLTAPLRKAHDGTHVIRDFLEGLGFDSKDAGAVKDRT